MWYIERDDILCHHGRKGQKWGERNGPPYPLNEKGNRNFLYKKAVREAKNAKQIVEDLGNYEVGLTTFWNDSYENGKKFVSGLANAHDWEWQEMGYNSSIGSYRPADIHKDVYMPPEYDEVDDNTGLLNENYIKSCNYGYGAPGTTMNCAKCSATLELAMKGYAYKAGRQTYPSSSDAMEFWFKDANAVDYDSPSSATKYLTSYGAGASGTLSMRYDNDGPGHAMHWTVSKQGNLRIEDGQNGRIFNSIEEVNNEYGFDGKSVHTYRLDDKEPNWENLAQDSVVRAGPSYSFVKNRISGRDVDTW